MIDHFTVEIFSADEEELPGGLTPEGQDIEQVRGSRVLKLVERNRILPPPPLPAALTDRCLHLDAPQLSGLALDDENIRAISSPHHTRI
jgi:hypothetical protein